MAGLGFCGSRDFQCFGKSHNDPIWNLIYAGETRREKVANFNPPAGGKILKIENFTWAHIKDKNL